MQTPHHKKLYPVLLPILTAFTAVAVQYWLMLISGFEYRHAGLGDGRLVNFTLEHGYRWLLGIEPHTDFWRAPLFYPYPTVSAFTDVMLGFAPPYWMFRSLGLAPDSSMQAWMMTVHLLNFASAYALLRTGLRIPVVLSCLVAFLAASFTMAWYGHLQLVPFFYVFLGILAVFRIFDKARPCNRLTRRFWVVVLFACFTLQLWSAIYAFFFFGLLAASALAVALLMPRTRPALVHTVRQDLLTWVCSALLAAAIAWPLVERYQATADELGYRPYREQTIARPLSWVIAGPQDSVSGWLLKPDGPIYLRPGTRGAGLLCLIVAASGYFFYRRRIFSQILIGAVAIMAIVGTHYGFFSPWRWIHEWVPGAGGIRAQYRITMILLPFCTIGIALACLESLKRKGPWLCGLLLLLCFFERLHWHGMIHKSFVRNHIDSIASRVNPDAQAFLLVSTGRHCDWIDDDAAWVTLATGVPTLNGRYGNYPKSWRLNRAVCIKDYSREELDQRLQQWLSGNGLKRSDIQVIEYDALERDWVRSTERK